MQNNVTELTQKLLRSLDSNYNVIDMPAVIEIISLLEKVTITKELLETTRLGKYVNQLRRNTTNESLAKRAKDLVKKWRDMVLPDSNGQLKPTTIQNDATTHHTSTVDELQTKKRPAKDPIENPNVKRTRINGQMSELDFSDNSNSSFKDLKPTIKPVIIINSDSNSSIPDTKHEPPLEQQQPKKRGRKKGSKNHKNLIEEAETSFSNKLNVSRGNAKVKTTQELLADLHIRSNNSTLPGTTTNRPIEDLNERAAKLTERVSIIDQKLNANSNRYRNSQKKNLNFRNNFNDLNELKNSNLKTTTTTDDDIIIVDDVEEKIEVKLEPKEEHEPENEREANEQQQIIPKSLPVEEALALLPPIDRSVLEEPNSEPQCSCQLIENKTDFSVEDNEEGINLQHTFEFVEDNECPAKTYLTEKYHLGDETLDKRVRRLHTECIPNVNGNYGTGCKQERPKLTITEDGLYVNVVPNVNTENLTKFSNIDYSRPASENFKKYSISEGWTEKDRGNGDGKDDDDNDNNSSGSSDRCCCSSISGTTPQGVAKNCIDSSNLSDCGGNVVGVAVAGECNNGGVEGREEEEGETTVVVRNGGNSDSDNRTNGDTTVTFREWHEVLETPSYEGEILKILPYVIID